MNKDILYFVKFGERKHLESLSNGDLFFSHAGAFIKQEREQQKKGQGDAYEGRMNFIACNGKMYDFYTNELIASMTNASINLGFEYVENMPIFCLTAGYLADCEYVNNRRYFLKFRQEKKKIIEKHFEKADTALIINKPEHFIQDVKKSFKAQCHADTVKYFNMTQITIDRLTYLETGSIEKKELENFDMTVDKAFRHLYCKDTFFKEQSEFRFAIPKLQIFEPQTFNIKMRNYVKLYDINTFFDGIEIML
ncbi:MAG: hypothetical protein CVU99_01565 [Firmicutes bacterium HGW-Firmicutes-4]|nr:MAG: hypothetical protein CVU99_01565 [Firmicutes bacterium HGW-Firmicutes-4]